MYIKCSDYPSSLDFPVPPRLGPATEDAFFPLLRLVFLLLVRCAAPSEGEGASSTVVGGPSIAEFVPRRESEYWKRLPKKCNGKSGRSFFRISGNSK